MLCEIRRKERINGRNSQMMPSRSMEHLVISNGNQSLKGSSSPRCQATTSVQVIQRQNRYLTTGTSTVGYLRNLASLRY